MMTRLEEELRPELFELLLPPAKPGAAVGKEVEVDTALSALVVRVWSKVKLPLTVRIVVTTCCVALITEFDVLIDERSELVDWVPVDCLGEDCEAPELEEDVVMSSDVGVREADCVCEAKESVVVVDAEVVVVDIEGALDEGFETAAEGVVFDAAAEVAAVDATVAEGVFELTPVPRGTFCRFCRAISMSSIALTPHSKVVKRSNRDMVVGPSIMSKSGEKSKDSRLRGRRMVATKSKGGVSETKETP